MALESPPKELQLTKISRIKYNYNILKFGVVLRVFKNVYTVTLMALLKNLFILIWIYMLKRCVCVCVCVREIEREKERAKISSIFFFGHFGGHLKYFFFKFNKRYFVLNILANMTPPISRWVMLALSPPAFGGRASIFLKLQVTCIQN